MLVPLCLSIALLAAFGLSETKYKTDGMLNHELFGFVLDSTMQYRLIGFAVATGMLPMPWQAWPSKASVSDMILLCEMKY